MIEAFVDAAVLGGTAAELDREKVEHTLRACDVCGLVRGGVGWDVEPEFAACPKCLAGLRSLIAGLS